MKVDMKVVQDEALRIMKDRSEAQSHLLRQLIVVSSVLLSLKIALIDMFESSNRLFQLSLVLDVLSIFFATTGLYMTVIQLRKLHKDYLAAVKDILNDKGLENHKSKGGIVSTRYDLLVIWIERLAFLSFVCSILLLLAYAFSLIY